MVNRQEVCKSCGGSGFTEKNREFKRCKKCKGTGVIRNFFF